MAYLSPMPTKKIDIVGDLRESSIFSTAGAALRMREMPVTVNAERLFCAIDVVPGLILGAKKYREQSATVGEGKKGKGARNFF